MRTRITTALASLAAFGALAAPQALAADSGTLELAPQPDEPPVMAPESDPLPQPGDPVTDDTAPEDDELVPTKGDDGQGAKPKKIERGEDEKVTDHKTIGVSTGKGGASDAMCGAAADALDYFQGLLAESLIYDLPTVGIMAGNAYDLLKSQAENRGCQFGTLITQY